jgi:hypothetical protein
MARVAVQALPLALNRITGYTLELDCANGQTQRLLAFYPFPGKPQIFIGQVTFNVE